MAGIGKYKKGAKFTLRSGNAPAFKMMGTPEPGDSPITNEFGIGKGTSPYKQEGDSNLKKGAKFAAGLGTAILTGGLDAAYGTGKVIPSNPFADPKADEEAQANTPEEKIAELTKGTDKTTKQTPKAKQMPVAEWEKGEKKAKDMGYNMDDLLKKQKNLDKNSQEWKDNQNLINEALNNPKRH